MAIVETALCIIGFILLVVGYRKNNRNILLTSALVLVFSVGSGDFVRGLTEGFNAGRLAQASH